MFDAKRLKREVKNIYMLLGKIKKREVKSIYMFLAMINILIYQIMQINVSI